MSEQEDDQQHVVIKNEEQDEQLRNNNNNNDDGEEGLEGSGEESEGEDDADDEQSSYDIDDENAVIGQDEQQQQHQLEEGDDEHSLSSQSNISSSHLSLSSTPPSTAQALMERKMSATKLTQSLLSSVRSLSKKVPIPSTSSKSLQQQQQHVVSDSTAAQQQQQVSVRCRYLRDNNFAVQKALHDAVGRNLQDTNQRLIDVNIPLNNTLTTTQEIANNIRLMNENLTKLNNLCSDISQELPRLFQIPPSRVL